MWVLYAFINVLLTAILFMLVPGRSLVSYVIGLSSQFGSPSSASQIGLLIRQIDDALPLGGLFGYGLLVSTASYAVTVIGIKCVYEIHKLNVSLLSILNFVSISLMVSSVIYVFAILFAIIYAPISLLLLMVAAAGNAILTYNGFRKAAPYDKRMFWTFLAANAIKSAIVFMIINAIFNSYMLDLNFRLF